MNEKIPSEQNGDIIWWTWWQLSVNVMFYITSLVLVTITFFFFNQSFHISRARSVTLLVRRVQIQIWSSCVFSHKCAQERRGFIYSTQSTWAKYQSRRTTLKSKSIRRGLSLRKTYLILKAQRSEVAASAGLAFRLV